MKVVHWNKPLLNLRFPRSSAPVYLGTVKNGTPFKYLVQAHLISGSADQIYAVNAYGCRLLHHGEISLPFVANKPEVKK